MNDSFRYIWICLLTFYAAAGLCADEQRVVAAEQVAEQYLRFFFAVEMEGAVELTHPEAVVALYQGLRSEYLKSKSAEDLDGFKQGFFLETIPTEFEEWSPEKWYVMVVTASNSRAPPEALQAMKHKTVEAFGSRRIDDSTAEVFLKLGPPGAAPRSSLILKMLNGEWKVLGSGPNE